MLVCCFIFVCNAHLNIFTWNLRDINVYLFIFFIFLNYFFFLVKFRLKCLPYVTVLGHVWHHVQRRHATQPTLSLPLRKNFEQPNKYILTVSRRGAVL